MASGERTTFGRRRGGGAIRPGTRVAPARPRRDLRRRPDEPGDLRVALRDPRLAAAAGRCSGTFVARHRLPRLHRRPRAQADPAREPLRRRARAHGGRHRRPAARLVLAHEVPPAVLARARGRRSLALLYAPGRHAQRHRRCDPADGDLLPQLRPAAAAVLPHEHPDPVRADAVLRPQADEGLRAGRRRLGRQARGRPRPGRAEGRGDEGHRAVVGRRGVPQGGRQARARPALHRRAGHRQDDALQGHRDVVQLADRDDARLGLRPDVHRHGRRHRHVPDPQGAQARPQVGRHVHDLHRRDRRRRHAPPGAAGRQLRLPPDDDRLRGAADVRAVGLADPDRATSSSRTASGASGCSCRAPSRPRWPRAGPLGAVRDRIQGVMFPGMGGMGGGLALNQLLVQMDGVDEPPIMRKFFTNRLNTFLDATYIVPRRIRKLRAAHQAAQAAARAGLLHRRHQRAPRGARPGAHPPRAHGPPHLVPHADEGRPQGHLRPLPGPRQPRRGPRQRRAPRRAGAHDQRVLPGHDRAGVLDGADLRALRGARAVRPQGHRRGDDHDRVGHRRRRELHRRGEPRRRHPRGRSRGGQPRLHARRPLHAAVDPHARRLAGTPPGDPEGGALLELAPRGGRQPRLDARRHGRRARLLRRELQRRGRRHPERHLDRVARWWA